ncbi:magnesium transporter [uncultured Eubacterium sp.]|uniref:magnesium transporter n=1 Tax=uncultured Eubacterium sp. TaxID=165185 RepID=UPI0034A0B138
MEENKNENPDLLEDEKRDMENQEEEKYEIPEKANYEEELIKIIRSDAPTEEKLERLDDYHENDIASALKFLDPEERRKLYSMLGVDKVSDIFSYIDDPADYIEELEPEIAAKILGNMEADDAVDILEELEDETSNELIELIDDEAMKDIDLIQSYDDDEIGSKMTTNYVSLTLGLTIKQAMKSLVKQAADNDNIATLYVKKEDGTFYGAIDLTDLIVAREYVDLETLVTTSYPYVHDHETVDDCIEELKDYSEDSIPVLDNNMHILGVITSQDLLEVVDEEMGEDYAKLAGLSAEEELEEPLGQSLKKRVPWLLILLMLGMGVSSVISMFEKVIVGLPIIVTFQSVILGMSGNVGTQSLAVTIRVLMDEELGFKERAGFVLKEIRVGLCNGLIVGGISVVFTGIFIFVARGQSLATAFAISGCIGGALALAMLISSFMGTIIPIILEKIGFDPAVASGPLISTINDLVAAVTYYGLAWIMLINILGL